VLVTHGLQRGGEQGAASARIARDVLDARAAVDVHDAGDLRAHRLVYAGHRCHEARELGGQRLEPGTGCAGEHGGRERAEWLALLDLAVDAGGDRGRARQRQQRALAERARPPLEATAHHADHGTATQLLGQRLRWIREHAVTQAERSGERSAACWITG
jgi:hypothetical protein